MTDGFPDTVREAVALRRSFTVETDYGDVDVEFRGDRVVVWVFARLFERPPLTIRLQGKTVKKGYDLDDSLDVLDLGDGQKVELRRKAGTHLVPLDVDPDSVADEPAPTDGGIPAVADVLYATVKQRVEELGSDPGAEDVAQAFDWLACEAMTLLDDMFEDMCEERGLTGLEGFRLKPRGAPKPHKTVKLEPEQTSLGAWCRCSPQCSSPWSSASTP